MGRIPPPKTSNTLYDPNFVASRALSTQRHKWSKYRHRSRREAGRTHSIRMVSACYHLVCEVNSNQSYIPVLAYLEEIDGGGVRGLSTLYILKGLMTRLNMERQAINLKALKPCEVFDLVGGTSTGGYVNHYSWVIWLVRPTSLGS